MESLLLPPFMREETPEVLSQEAAEELRAILVLCERLLKAGETRIVFTSREALPAPFDVARNRRELHQLDREDAVKLVERVLNAAGDDGGASSDAAREEIEQLVDAVHCHARTLALLASSLRNYGVEATRESLVELMAEMEKNFPGSREKSVFASVELSLRRMSQENRERARVLGVFHGGSQSGGRTFNDEMGRSRCALPGGRVDQDGTSDAKSLQSSHAQSRALPLPAENDRSRHSAISSPRTGSSAMRGYVEFLQQQQSRNIEVAATLTGLELPNLFALLDIVQRAKDAEATIDLTTSLYQLLQALGKPRLLERIGQVRDVAAAALGDTWIQAQFDAARTRIEQQLAAGRIQEALMGAEQLLQRAREAGEKAYPGADYDVALSCFLWPAYGTGADDRNRLYLC